MQDDLKQEQARGKDARSTAPRATLGAWQPAADRPDPVALLASQDASREVDLVPIRHQRMSASAFSFSGPTLLINYSLIKSEKEKKRKRKKKRKEERKSQERRKEKKKRWYPRE